ncbi:hypothetical protein BJF93_21930 [Xaviernesmea oryzae]|uniref:Uncharacterized protein n=1 Tax=Xaviernesmea oryzae TaxID=464029 RepID=A0A1Q9AWG4_9HYPH|nr:hypothetical protein BJF93_21930 [Xaviernesmea oryzae]
MSTDRFALENAAHLIKVSKSLITLEHVHKCPSDEVSQLLSVLEKASAQIESLRQRLESERRN